MHGRRFTPTSLALATAALLVATPAAASVRLGLGADYWLAQGAEFNLTLAIDTPLARNIHIGGRFGALVTAGPNNFGVPIDLELRAYLGRIYVEGLVGPWLMFGGDFLRAHAAFGFGLLAGQFSFGLEIGYLSPAAIGGLKVAFRI
jgi:hypothetical protein